MGVEMGVILTPDLKSIQIFRCPLPSKNYVANFYADMKRIQVSF